MGEVEETNYRPGNGLTRRVQGVGEGLEGVTLPSPFAAEMTEAEADALVNNHRALYQQALKRRETIASSVGKTKCVHTLSGVPVPQKKSRAAKSGGQKGKRRRKAGATTGSQADLPAPASTEEELVTDGLPDLPLPASSQQQQQTAGGVLEMSSDGPIVNPANLTRDNNGNVIVKTSLEKKEFAVKALDTFTWLITDAPVECMEFFPTFEVFQPHLITKYQLCGVNRDEYFYATGGRIEFEKLVMKVIKTKRSNTHKKVRFYAWGAGGLVDESKWPLLAVEQIIPSKKRTEEKWLEEFRHVVPTAVATSLDIALSSFSLALVTRTFYSMWRVVLPVAGETEFELLGFILVMLASFMAAPAPQCLCAVLALPHATILRFLTLPRIFAMVTPSSCHYPPAFPVLLVPLASHQPQVRPPSTPTGLTNPLLTLLQYLAPVMALVCGIFSLLHEPWSSLASLPYFDTWPHSLWTLAVMPVGGVLAFCMVGGCCHATRHVSLKAIGCTRSVMSSSLTTRGQALGPTLAAF
ncbi:unnamed protein product [Closterium sp. NIES-65]|nr:unnamed protein product [Closterium sp. NIES-65]